MPSAGLSSLGAAYLFVPLALCALCTGFTGVILTAYEWWRYYVRGRKGNPESALPLIALSLFNAPFFWLVLKITAYFV